MNTLPDSHRGFTLIELLVVVAVMAILAALLLPVLGAAKGKAKRMTCSNNLRQINLGIHMYCDDSRDAPPDARFPAVAYKALMKSYLGLNGTSSPRDKAFACPADTFHYHDIHHQGLYFTNAPQHEQAYWDFSSYWFNGLNSSRRSVPRLGIAGVKIASIKEPVRTVLVAETLAFLPYSWHQPEAKAAEAPMFNNARDVVSFVDGHVNLIKIYWQEEPGNSLACEYEPPAGYDYKLSGD
jgi:prepilin-type N-terminal cleavage/methylation domain-containing protein